MQKKVLFNLSKLDFSKKKNEVKYTQKLTS